MYLGMINVEPLKFHRQNIAPESNFLFGTCESSKSSYQMGLIIGEPASRQHRTMARTGTHLAKLGLKPHSLPEVVKTSKGFVSWLKCVTFFFQHGICWVGIISASHGKDLKEKINAQLWGVNFPKSSEEGEKM